MKRWVKVVLGVVVGVPLAAYAIGSVLPRDHVARMSIDLSSPPDRVWALVADFAGTARWRSDITGVRMLPATGGPVRFIEMSSQGDIPFEIVSQEAPRRQVVRIVDEAQPFGGTWTWEIESVGTGVRLTITENGFVKSPIFRVMGALFFSPTATMDGYLRALAKELGESAVPRVQP